MALGESEKRAAPENPGPIDLETLKYRYNTKMPLVVRWISINNGLCFLRLNKPAFYCFSFELPFFPQTRGKRGTQLAEHVSRRRPMRVFYRVSARLFLFPKNSNRGFFFHRCGELFLLYVTSQTTKSQMVPYHLLYPIRGRHEVVATVGV